ncbi:hypothetical protein [Burkholderia pyrrocinia]|uniref:hypothetical protein n=1 Tax=Burkholderia pyrrocinia TaxID=60550 RepID=UPI001FC8AA23|nr:hypothetical protein [Burkholderia pyrrocinia]
MIAQVISPVSVVIQDGKTRQVAMLPGRPVYYCGLDAFVEWASPLIGQAVRSSPEAGISQHHDAKRGRGWQSDRCRHEQP